MTAKQLFLRFFEYYTPKIVLIKNWKVGVLNRIVQLTILGYIIGYVIIYNKGYQNFSNIESAVTTKVKGIVYTNFSDDEFNKHIEHPELYRRIWDTPDYVIPPSESNAFFVTTNILISPNQSQGICPEDPDVPDAKCQTDDDCEEGKPFITGNGVPTGKCIDSDIKKGVRVCQIHAWCPVERDVNPLENGTALLTETKNFTVLIKNFVEFPKFNIRRRNIPDYADDSHLKHCKYHPVQDPKCPIFVLGDIVPGDYDEIAAKGGAVAIVIDWDCNFNLGTSDCFPTYSFTRLDEQDAKVAKGLNFRYAHYYSDANRTLYKAYGIKFIIMAQGRGGKFSVIPLLLNVGSGIGLLAVATVLCDIVVLYFVKQRDLYKSSKYESVGEGSASNHLSNAIRQAGTEQYTNPLNG